MQQRAEASEMRAKASGKSFDATTVNTIRGTERHRPYRGGELVDLAATRWRLWISRLRCHRCQIAIDRRLRAEIG